MPARLEEQHHAKEEGVNFMTLHDPAAVLGDENGWVRGVILKKMELGEPDESGRRSPKAIPGSEFEYPLDTLIVAIGQSPNPLIKQTTPDIMVNKRGCIVTDESTETSRPGVFAGGDVVTGAATVILAMGAGKKAAAAIDAYVEQKHAALA